MHEGDSTRVQASSGSSSPLSPISGCRTSVRLDQSFQAMASSLTGAASFYAATARQAIAAAVPPSPRPLKVVSWNTGPARNRGPSILGKLRGAGVAEEFDVILLQELPFWSPDGWWPASVSLVPARAALELDHASELD